MDVKDKNGNFTGLEVTGKDEETLHLLPAYVAYGLGFKELMEEKGKEGK